MARLHQRVHEIGEAGIEGRRGRLRGRRCLRLDAPRTEHAGGHQDKDEDKDKRIFEHRLSPCEWRGEMTPRSSSSAKLVTTLRRKATSGLPHRPGRRNIAPMHFSRQVLSAAIMLACLAGTAHAGPAGCELNKVAPARVATKDPRVYFVAGANARASACPSAASACRLRAYVMPGDEVLVDPTDGPYLCAFFKSQGGTETRGWLPRALLELVLPPLCRRGNGTATGSATGKRRSSSSRAATRSRFPAARCGEATIRSACGGAEFTSANSAAPVGRAVRRSPSATTPIDPPFRRRRIKRPTPAPRSSISTAAISWSRT